MKIYLIILLTVCFSNVFYAQNEIKVNLKVEKIFFSKKAFVIEALDTISSKEYIIISFRVAEIKHNKKYKWISIGKTYTFLLKGIFDFPLNVYRIADIYSGIISPAWAKNLQGLYYIPLPTPPPSHTGDND